MTVYVDDWRQWARLGPVETRWSHLLADDADELHAFAARLGLRRAWYQVHRRHPALNHYDVSDEARQRAITLGATALTWRETGRMIRRWRHDRPAPASEISAGPVVRGRAGPAGPNRP